MNCAPPPCALPRMETLERLLPLSSRSYPALYAALARMEGSFSPGNVYPICREAIYARLTPRATAALLARCPPLPPWRYDRPLLYEACCFDRADILDWLLRQGADPLVSDPDFCSLEAAIVCGSPNCTRRLLQEEGLAFQLTPRLLLSWAKGTRSPLRTRRCLQLAAPRLTGMAYPLRGPVPLLPQLRPSLAVMADNLPLARSLCLQGGGVTVQEGEDTLRAIWDASGRIWDPHLPALLDALLTACPGLLQRTCAQRSLIVCRLASPVPYKRLDFWLARLPRRHIPLWEGPELTGLYWLDHGGEEGLLTRWRSLPDLPAAPVLDRNAPLPWCLPEEAARLLRACPVQGAPPAGRLSALAQDVLGQAPEALILEQLEPGGFLRQEDPAALLAFCLRCPLRLRGAVLAHLPPRTEDYAL